LRAYIESVLANERDVPRDILEHFPSFGASDLVSDRIVVQYRDARFDCNTVNIAMTILRLISMLRDELPSTVCDIGGGIGATALSWLRNTAHRPDYVVIVDLPETLFFADVLLRFEFGRASVRYLLDNKPVNPAAVGAKVVLCPVSNIAALRDLQLDLVTNTLSMQEMTDDWVDWYMQWLDKQNCSYFYSSNYFGTALAKMLEGRNSWSPRPSPKWRLQRFRVSDEPDRPNATQMFKRTSADLPIDIGAPSRLDRWLMMLDGIRMSGCQDPELLRSGLQYGLELSPIPKETWQLARALQKLTEDSWAKSTFSRLDEIRQQRHAVRAATQSGH
jgi:hypothetical protein